MLKKPAEMDTAIWKKYLSSNEVSVNEIEVSLKLSHADFIAKYGRILSKNILPSQYKLLRRSKMRISILEASLPHQALIRMAFFIYGPRNNPVLLKLDQHFKKLGIRSGWQASFLLFCFNKLYSNSKEFDWDFFLTSLYVFAINSGYLYTSPENRKESLELIKSKVVNRRRKKLSNSIDEESFFRDFGEAIFLTTNYKNRKNNPEPSFKEKGRKERLIKNRLSARLSKFSKRIEASGLKTPIPYEFLAISEYSSI